MKANPKIYTSSPRKKVYPHTVYKLKVSLLDSPYPLWREVLLDADMHLGIVQVTLLLAMGWQISHLYQLEVDNVIYSSEADASPDLIFSLFRGKASDRDASLYKLDQVFAKKPVGLLTYDFGDCWEHEVRVLEILPDSTLPIPYCVSGQGACPPEDCGGIPGFEHMLEVLQDSGHPEYEELMEWLSDDFDSDGFDIKRTNKILKS